MDSITNVKDIETAQILHTKIAAGLNLMGQGLFETCINLKKMHDGMYYKALGYEALEDYTKDRFDIGKRQAYTYIQAIEQLGEDFVQSNARLGITKLQLLATVPVFDRMELIDNNDIEEMSVPEVKELIKKPEQVSFFADEKPEEEKAEHDEKLKKEIDELKEKLKKSDEKAQKGADEIKKLKDRLKKPSKPDPEADKLKAENSKLKIEADEAIQKAKAFKSANEGINIRLQQEQEKVKKLESEISKMQLTSKPETADPKETFKFYYKNSIDGFKSMLGFIEKIDTDKTFYIKKTGDLLQTLLSELEKL